MLAQQLLVDEGRDQLDGEGTRVLLGLRLVVPFALTDRHTLKVYLAQVLKSALVNFPIQTSLAKLRRITHRRSLETTRILRCKCRRVY